MVSMVEFLHEGKIWNSLKSSFANLFGGPPKAQKPNSPDDNKSANATYRRLTPRPLVSNRNRLGYKPKKSMV